MKILAITSSYPRFPGDATAPFIESIVSGVAELGHEVHVLVPEHHAWNRQAVEGPVHYHSYRYSPRRSWTPWGFSASLDGARIRKPLYALAPLVIAAGSRAARRVLAGGDFDVAHVHWVVPNGPVGAHAAERAGVPLVVSLHGSDVAVAERSRLAGRGARWTFDRAAAVTAPSRDLLDRAARLGAREPRELVPYGADAEALQADPEAVARLRADLGLREGDLVVTGIGRLIPVKGFAYLVEAHSLLAAREPSAKLVLVGDGDEREQLAGRARELGIASSVVFAGTASRTEIPAYLALSDVVVVPSIRFGGYVDGLPNVALEAMAAGRPLVASAVGGLPDLVRSGENGLLVEEKSARALADALSSLLADPQLRARLGENARAEVRSERSWEAVARRFVDVYERAASRRA